MRKIRTQNTRSREGGRGEGREGLGINFRRQLTLEDVYIHTCPANQPTFRKKKDMICLMPNSTDYEVSVQETCTMFNGSKCIGGSEDIGRSKYVGQLLRRVDVLPGDTCLGSWAYIFKGSSRSRSSIICTYPTYRRCEQYAIHDSPHTQSHGLRSIPIQEYSSKKYSTDPKIFVEDRKTLGNSPDVEPRQRECFGRRKAIFAGVRSIAPS